MPRKSGPNRVSCGTKYCKLFLCNRAGDEVAFTLIDKASLPLVSDRRWRMGVDGYAGDVSARIHRVILKLPPWKRGDDGVDHINRNRLDNRLTNLRVVSHTENMWNVKCLGVHRHGQTNAWVAQIKYNGIHKHIGCFKTKREALRARKDAEKKYRGT